MKIKKLTILNIFFLAGFLSSIEMAVFFYVPYLAVCLSICVVFLAICLKKRNMLSFSSRKFFSFLCIVLISIYIGLNEGSLFSSAGLFLQYSPVMLFILLKKEIQVQTLNFITVWLAALLTVSLIVHIIITFLGIPIPSLGNLPIQRGPTVYAFRNYIVYVKPAIDSVSNHYRFYGAFIEPGYMATACVLLLFANKFDFRKWTSKIFLTVILFSFSLAGYVLFLVGFCFCGFQQFKKTVYAVIVLIPVILVCSYVFNVEDKNLLYELIGSRLEYDEGKGIAGNNRFMGATDELFDESLHNGKLWFGLKDYQYLARERIIWGAGYKLFLLQHGIIGAMFVLLFYFSIIGSAQNKKYAFLFLILIVINFLQRTYPTWMAILIPYIAGISLNDLNIKNNKIKENEKNRLAQIV